MLWLLLTPAAAAPAVGGSDGAVQWPRPPCSLTYVLQADALSGDRVLAVDRIARAARDVVVIDRAFSPGQPHWSNPEIASLRHAAPARRVLAYFSIGEAENYRAYWSSAWHVAPDGSRARGTPEFLVAPNPDWPGNFKVRYWSRAWQQIVFDDLTRLIEQGFDGAYLDIVDAFQYFEFDSGSDSWIANRANPHTGRSYREDMVAWVLDLAARARRSRPDFLIVPQNGSALVHVPRYLAAISALAVEDLFTLGNEKQTPEHTATVLADIALVGQAGKPVFAIEYADTPELIEYATQRAAKAGIIVHFTNRELTATGHSLAPPGCAAPPR